MIRPVLSLSLLAVLGLAACEERRVEEQKPPSAASTSATAAAGKPSEVERGRYLVAIGACNDCHTPLAMGPNGPAPDMTRALSGHPASLEMPAAPKLPAGPWGVTIAATNTAWSGPWGVSYTANLTPDIETGIGSWTRQTFIDTVRSGRHMGAGRPLLPPMPVAAYAAMTDDDLGAIYAFLKTVPAISNKVPAPTPPGGTPTSAKLSAKGS